MNLASWTEAERMFYRRYPIYKLLESCRVGPVLGPRRTTERVRRGASTGPTHFMLINPTLETHIQAAEVFDACRKRGYTIRSIIDCLIASLALEYDLTILENDRDYGSISKVFPLKTFR